MTWRAKCYIATGSRGWADDQVPLELESVAVQ